MLNSVIDISHHNHVDSFAALHRQGILGVIHKATQGGRYRDPELAENRKRIAAEGLLFGAYHFGVAGDASAQAGNLLSASGPGALLVLDFEPNPQGKDMSLEEAEEFVHYIHSATGHYPGLYSGHTIKEALLRDGISRPEQTELSKCWLWIAQYGPAPLIPKIWTTWSMWQYTDGACGPPPYTVEGIGRCDRDRFNGSADELAAFWQRETQAK